jgi:DNA recombination protein RmuC
MHACELAGVAQIEESRKAFVRRMPDKAQKNIQTGLNQLEDVVGVRTRAIQKRLKGVDTITDTEVQKIFPELTSDEIINDEEE